MEYLQKGIDHFNNGPKNSNWDKEMTQKLTALGISWNEAREVVGIIAEERQTADRQGYERGYNNGFENAKRKYT
jgi:hypothetical protein